MGAGVCSGMGVMVMDRFNKFISPIPEAGCWLWTGGLWGNGYGRFSLNGKQSLAHRISWLFNNGVIPQGTLVLHKCDVKSCVNPSHLFLGSHADNTADMYSKGRNAKLPYGSGEANPHSKLKQDDVDSIRLKRNSGTSMYKLAKLFHISQMHVRRIVRNESWIL